MRFTFTNPEGHQLEDIVCLPKFITVVIVFILIHDLGQDIQIKLKVTVVKIIENDKFCRPDGLEFELQCLVLLHADYAQS